MKLTFLLLFFTVIAPWGYAQKIITKDGVELADKSVFIESCVAAANGQMLEINGVAIGVEDYCSCVCDALFPRITSGEFMEATANNTMEELLLGGDNLSILLECVQNHLSYSDDFSLKHIADGKYKSFAVKACLMEILSDPEMSSIWTESQAAYYCECAIEELAQKGLTFEQLSSLENVDSEAFNEIVIPCVQAALSLDEEIIEDINSADIIGDNPSSSVALIEINGAYKVKLNIDGTTRYFLLDTGATELTINQEIERELLLNGSLSRSSYIGKETYTLADNRVVEADIVVLNKVQIGDYMVNNVTAAIIPGGALLCGTGLLNKFSDWTIERKNKSLLLTR